MFSRDPDTLPGRKQMDPAQKPDTRQPPAPSLGACTWAYVWKSGIEDSLRSLASLGYGAMDILTIPPHPFPSEMGAADRSRLKAFARELGITIETLNIPSTDVNLCSVNRDMRQFTVSQIRSTLELASDLETPMVTAVPGRRLNFNAPEADQMTGWLSACLEELLPSAEKLGVAILLELHPLSCLPNTDALRSFLDRLGASQLGIALDVSNAAYVGDSPAAAILQAAPWLRQLHLSDTKAGKWQHDVVGAGDVDFVAIMDAIRDIRFAGTSIVEITAEDPDRAYSMSASQLQKLGWRV